MATIREWLKANQHRFYPDKKYDCTIACAKRLGVSVRSVQNILPQEWDSKAPAKVQETEIPKEKCGMSKQEFVEKFDEITKTRKAIRNGVRAIEREKIFEEREFREKLCNLRYSAHFKRVGQEEEFSRNLFAVGDKRFWARPKTKDWALENVPKARSVA